MTPPFARLKHYAPGTRQALHAHDAAHLSLVLSGGFEEEACGEREEATPGRVGLRPDGLRHAVAFGQRGAIVLTFVPPLEDGRPTVDYPAWSASLPCTHLRRLTPLLIENGDDAVEAGWDLLSLATRLRPKAQPDAWLADLHTRLLESPGETRIADLAREAGRHRVHVGRAFMAAYGEPPSVFRRRSMLDRALCLGARGVAPAQAALEAGFADQSHFSRTCRDVFGVSPGRLLRLAA